MPAQSSIFAATSARHPKIITTMAEDITAVARLGDADGGWLELTDRKQMSRLLYTNPVCFLSTVTSNTATTNAVDSISPPHYSRNKNRNVMIVSWLTATNNLGGLVFSIHKSRHTASQLCASTKFALSVPVQGMEDLVRDVGHTSGRFGSKFRSDHDSVQIQELNTILKHPFSEERMSKRQKRKLEKERLSCGIPNLHAVKLGTDDRTTTSDPELFAIQGCVAHMECCIRSVMKDCSMVDEQHLLVAADVTKAFVKMSYWDVSMNLFRPTDGMPPYLTFFGSQTFGYVVTK